MTSLSPLPEQTTSPSEQEPGEIPDWAYGVRRLVVFSGAGLSTDSGIQDFRGPSGVWTLSPGQQTRHTYQAFMTDPDLRVSYWKTRYEHPAWEAEPNAGHRAVATLADSDIDTVVVTQNTDGLHQLAGTPADRVVELHGTMRTTLCVACGYRGPTTDVLTRIAAGEATPSCPQCGGIQKTASTMFGQTMSPEVFARAQEAVTSCDLILATGTTLTVEPAGSLCAAAVHAGATLVIVNWDPTPYDAIATDLIRDPLGEALPRIVAQLRAAAATSAAGSPGPGSAPGRAVADGPVASPGELLRTTARTARLRSRTVELDGLVRWCEGTGTKGRLLSGPAGVGKSRLALELADRLVASGAWDVEFLAPDAEPPASDRPLLVVVEDAETRREQVARIFGPAGARPSQAPVRVLLLARTRDGWWDTIDDGTCTSEELAAPDGTDSAHADAVREAARDYAAALTALGHPCPPLDQDLMDSLLATASALPRRPGSVQAAVLAALLDLAGGAQVPLAARETAHLQRSAAVYGLRLAPQVVEAAVATAALCGAADEEAALAALGHVQALEDPALRLRTAQWLRTEFPPAPESSPSYWNESLPDGLTEDLLAVLVTPRFLMSTLMETNEEQDRRALTVLARAADTRPEVRARLAELVSLLPGVSPMAIEVALSSGYAAPLAEALTALAEKHPALPADLLDAVPTGVTVFGEFPVLLAESLVDAYELRAKTQNGLRGLTKTLVGLSGRLADLGRGEQALGTARRAVESAARLEDGKEWQGHAAQALHRATQLTA
ncbi:SIR2 family NAD-dependent protein deacylase [Streptomyces sp. NRRL S-241]|uniref:SIR2 family NAD-dependent protein deacylase n=1 Tax=Streptomyces sp. NRRL S-241 TaxID=1463896 RepID=UPI0007C564EB|nr:Sir2 family NAD-dependent protein deacetylase [Streptomyces sp. NRRL S-241]